MKLKDVRAALLAMPSPAYPTEGRIDLPAPAQRYFAYALHGSACPRAVGLHMHGEIRPNPKGAWLPFTARQIIAPGRGFAWEASAGRGLPRLVGGDYYFNNEACVAFRLWNILPVVRAGGPDIARSARGRLAMESIFLPSSLRHAAWETLDEHCARCIQQIDGETIAFDLTVDERGVPRHVDMLRWSDQTDDKRFAPVPFGVNIIAMQRFGDWELPALVSVGWHRGEERYATGEFFRARITAAEFF
ncbi:MAG TPA: hypothetical protein PKW95_02340 [bacterium]|nr:hypothetical protein [bacterium]